MIIHSHHAEKGKKRQMRVSMITNQKKFAGQIQSTYLIGFKLDLQIQVRAQRTLLIMSTRMDFMSVQQTTAA